MNGTLKHAIIATYVHTYTAAQLRMYTPTHLHTYTATYVHTYTAAQPRMYTLTQLHSHICTHLHIYTAYVHTYTPTQLHTYIPAQVYTYTAVVHEHRCTYMWMWMYVYLNVHWLMEARHILVALSHVGGLASESSACTCTVCPFQQPYSSHVG